MTAPLHEDRPTGPGRRLPDTQQGMRRRNLARVMHTVSAEGPLSRAAVASHIGLTRAAVGGPAPTCRAGRSHRYNHGLAPG